MLIAYLGFDFVGDHGPLGLGCPFGGFALLHTASN